MLPPCSTATDDAVEDAPLLDNRAFAVNHWPVTIEAVAAHEALHNRILEVARTLTESEWIAPSACAGWRVRDVVAHIGAGARNLIDPLPMPDERLPLPSVREREHDVHVDIRRDWPIGDVLDEMEVYGAQRLARLGTLQEEPLASTPLEVPGLGTYPMHAVANGLAFDCLCHLYHDIAAPGGPVQRELPAPSHEELYPVVQWMMWGLPQMQGPELDESLTSPVTIRLTGPGESTWTVYRPDPEGGLVVEESGGGDAAVTSTAFAFVSWGTARTPWRSACETEGDIARMSGFLSTLNIV